MLAHEEVWKAIDALAERNGLSPSGLARRSGLDPTTFNRSKRHAPDGRPRWPSTESISKILTATNTPMSDLFPAATERPPGGALAVPLLGEAHAGFEMAQSDHPVGGGMPPRPARIIAFPDKRHEPLYALSVVGDSMQPLYRDGDVLFVSPNAEAEPGDRVVVKLKNNEVVVKVLKERSEEQLAFHAVNPEHADVAFTADTVEWIAKIVYATQ